MKKRFVKTSNYERFQAAIRFVEARGALEASWLLVEGSPGYGKTETVEEWVAKNNAIYLRAKEKYSPAFMYEELAEKLKVDGGGTRKERFQRLITRVMHTQVPIVLDEVQHALPNGASVLEALRDITDTTETIAILVAGEDRVQKRIAKFPQLSRRIRETVEFTPASAEDTALICHELAEVAIALDLQAEIHRQSKGLVSAVINAIAAVEQLARRNKKDAICLADMAGQELVHDWQAGRPQIVRAGGR
ncbi:MAG: AAA family ATPase [Rhodocyclaceae bacterium]|nr:AAA family ATPase [Rhodocyclaceae bacterium]